MRDVEQEVGGGGSPRANSIQANLSLAGHSLRLADGSKAGWRKTMSAQKLMAYEEAVARESRVRRISKEDVVSGGFVRLEEFQAPTPRSVNDEIIINGSAPNSARGFSSARQTQNTSRQAGSGSKETNGSGGRNSSWDRGAGTPQAGVHISFPRESSHDRERVAAGPPRASSLRNSGRFAPGAF